MQHQLASVQGFLFARHFERRGGPGDEIVINIDSSPAVKRPRHFSFYLVGFYLILSGNMGKDV